jgi:tetratricopeptide (TPR) repeat protein
MRYVGNHCSTGCVIYPELHSRLGWALAEQGKTAEAIQHYQLAIKAQPKYSQAYARLSDLYVELNQPDEARKVLESGLKAKPKSRMLQRRMQKLGEAD